MLQTDTQSYGDGKIVDFRNRSIITIYHFNVINDSSLGSNKNMADMRIWYARDRNIIYYLLFTIYIIY